MRAAPYDDKRRLYTFLIVLGLLLMALLFLRFVLSMDEDTWICKDGIWIEHGSPKNPKPLSPCE